MCKPHALKTYDDAMRSTARSHRIAAAIAFLVVTIVTALLADAHSLMMLNPEKTLPMIAEPGYVWRTAHDNRTHGIGIGLHWWVSSDVGTLKDQLANNHTAGPIELAVLDHPATYLGCSGLRAAEMMLLAFGL
eukprot:1714035-Prymnesium_polylepis.1